MTSDCPGIIELTGKFTPLKLNSVLLQAGIFILPNSLQTHTQLSHKYWINRKKCISVTQECEARQGERKYKTELKTLALTFLNIYITDKQISKKRDLLHHFERRLSKAAKRIESI